MKYGLRAGIAIGLALAGLFVLAQCMARFIWLLPELANSPANTVASLEGVSQKPPVTDAVHQVSEWPPDRPRDFHEAPVLHEQVVAGALPPVDQRLPQDPLMITPPQQCGPYGGVWQRLATSPLDVGNVQGRLCFESLLRFGPMGDAILPNLAVGWNVEDDGRAFTFRLRKGVRWSDGAPFSADDIMFWYEDLLQNPELTPTLPSYFVRGGELMVVEKLDEHTVRFCFREPYGLFPQLIAGRFGDAMVSFPAHYLKQFLPKYTPLEELTQAARAERLDFWYQLYSRRQEWTNPEQPRLTAWVLKDPPPARPVLWERNPYYWKVDPEGNQLPYINSMAVDIYDAETINLKALNGEVGMQGRHLAFSNYPMFKENQQRGGYRVLDWIDGGDMMNVVCLNLNHRDPVMRGIIQDRRFRIALSVAINRPELNKACYFGMGVPRQVSPPASSPYYSCEYAKAYTEYNPDEANRLLDEMGLDKRDKRGVRLRPDGKPIHITLEISSAMLYPLLIQLVAEYWTAVGVESEMKLLARELMQRRIDAMLHDATVWTGAGEYLPVLDSRYFFPQSAASYQALDYARWYTSRGKKGQEPPPEMKRCMDIFRQVEAAVDPVEQRRLFGEIIDMNQQNLWVMGLIGEVPAIHLVKNTFRNVPEVSVFTFALRSPANTAPECYAIEED